MCQERGSTEPETALASRWTAISSFLADSTIQVKIRGHRVEPRETESALAALDQVDEAAVVAERGPDGSLRLIGFVTGAPGRPDPEPSSLLTALRRELPGYSVPWACRVVERMPMTATGKIDRRALHSIDVRPPGVEPPSATVSDDIDRELLAIWRRVLAAPDADRDGSFFDLGGHSLLALELLARIREVFGVELSLAAFFQSPTVAALAEDLRARGARPRCAAPGHESGSASRSL